jgi:hypothetical protein
MRLFFSRRYKKCSSPRCHDDNLSSSSAAASHHILDARTLRELLSITLHAYNVRTSNAERSSRHMYDNDNKKGRYKCWFDGLPEWMRVGYWRCHLHYLLLHLRLPVHAAAHPLDFFYSDGRLILLVS